MRNHEGRCRFEEWQRGSLNEIVVGSTVAVALRFLTSSWLIGAAYLVAFDQPPELPYPRLHDDDDEGQRLRWETTGCTFCTGGPRIFLRAS